MPAVGKRSEVTGRAMTRLAAEGSKTTAPTVDAQADCLNQAIDWYDQMRPLRLTFQTGGDGVTRRFVLATLIGAAWVAGTSEVVAASSVTDPDGNDEKVRAFELDEWSQIKASNGADVLMIAEAVPTGTTLRLIWTSPHTVHTDDAALTTIPTKDADAFVSMFAAKLARWISRRASEAAASSFGADQVDMEPISERWKRRAAELEKEATERLSPTTENISSAGASVEWRDESAITGSNRIGH